MVLSVGIGESSVYVLGVSLAFFAAFAWACQYLAIRLGADGGSLKELMLVTLACNTGIVIPVALLFYGTNWELTASSIVWFSMAGLIGLLIGRLLMYWSVDLIGASRTSPIVASSTLFASLFAIIFLEEIITGLHALGIVFVVVGIAITSWETESEVQKNQSTNRWSKFILLPIAAAILIGTEPIFISWGLEEGTPVVPGFVISSVAATIGFLFYLVTRDDMPSLSLVFHSNRVWYLAAGLASTSSLFAYYAALNIAPVSVVIPISQIAPLIVVVLSALFLPRRLEKINLRVGLAAGVVVIGAVIISTV